MSSERYTEQVDQAQEQQIANNERGIENARANLAPQSHPHFDGSHCVDCPELLPIARLHMGRIRCVTCQELVEQDRKRRGR